MAPFYIFQLIFPMVRKTFIIGLALIISIFSLSDVVSARGGDPIFAVPVPNPVLYGAPGFVLLRSRYDHWEPVVYTGTNILIRGGLYTGPHSAVVDGANGTPNGGGTGTGTNQPGSGTAGSVPAGMPGTGGGGAAGRY